MIYLDYNATTPIDARAFAKMLPFLREQYGNPSSRHHALGWGASEAVEEARDRVAELINARVNEIVFTSGATEGINQALKGLVLWGERRLVTSVAEHEGVLATARQLERFGRDVTRVRVDWAGRPVLEEVERILREGQPALVCLMAANNEIGTLTAIDEAARLTHRYGGLFMTDATQAVGKVPMDVLESDADLAVCSGHKVYGPKGIGALFVRSGRGIELEALIAGGGQEKGRRAGTLNVPSIVGFGEACRIAQVELANEAARLAHLRDHLEALLLDALPNAAINGDVRDRLPNTTNVCFRGVDATTLLRHVCEVAASTKSSCSSAAPGPSHVLKAIGMSDEDAYASVRLSLGRFTTRQEIQTAVERLVAAVLFASGRTTR
jgi:cysteine desulfurase